MIGSTFSNANAVAGFPGGWVGPCACAGGLPLELPAPPKPEAPGVLMHMRAACSNFMQGS